MRIANVIKIKAGFVVSIESYPVHEEQPAYNAIRKVEVDFTKKVLKLGAKDTDMDIHLENGYYQNKDESVCIAWSDIEI